MPGQPYFFSIPLSNSVWLNQCWAFKRLGDNKSGKCFRRVPALDGIGLCEKHLEELRSW